MTYPVGPFHHFIHTADQPSPRGRHDVLLRDDDCAPRRDLHDGGHQIQDPERVLQGKPCILPTIGPIRPNASSEK